MRLCKEKTYGVHGDHVRIQTIPSRGGVPFQVLSPTYFKEDRTCISKGAYGNVIFQGEWGEGERVPLYPSLDPPMLIEL